MNVKGDPAATTARINSLGFHVTQEHMAQLADDLGEKTLFGRTGGAATLAVGMAGIFSKTVNGRGLDLWYHFAIMFEALFILTTLDAGTRVGRYLLQDVLGQIWKPLGDTRRIGANLLASILMVTGWGYFLIQGVRDPLGGINSLWPLFGIANQLLAAIALCLATTVIFKMQLAKPRIDPGATGRRTSRGLAKVWAHPALALITLGPLLWLLAVTMTAGIEKIGHPDPRIGFLAQARTLRATLEPLEKALRSAQTRGSAEAIAAEQALRTNRVLHFNNLLDAGVALSLLLLTAAIALVSAREWYLMLSRRSSPVLRETEPVWLPPEEVSANGAVRLAGMVPLALALAQQSSRLCRCEPCPAEGAASASSPKTKPQLYLEITQHRFKGVNRCC
jgi:carbon starvation protein